MKLAKLEHALAQAWSKDSSYAPEEWHEDNPTYGQCAVTALVVEEYLGGCIMNTVAVLPDGTESSHYYNVVDGKEIDFTRAQFPEGTIFPAGFEKKGSFESVRARLLSDTGTKQRYEILKARVEQYLEGQGI